MPGAPKDGFLLNALRTLFRLSRVLLDLQKCIPRGAKKTFICWVILGQPCVFFPENFSCNLKFHESEDFSDSFLYRIFGSENFRFPFSTKNSLTWGVKQEKLNFRKSQGIYQISFKNCTCMERSSNKFLVFLKLQKILGNFASPNRYFTENSRWVPLICIGDFFTLFMSYCQKVKCHNSDLNSYL